jgi:hypothetical protein
MTTDRIEEIIKGTAYPQSNSVLQALYQVWNEVQQECNKSRGSCKTCKYSILFDNELYCGFVKVGNEEKKEDNWYCADYEEKEN